MCLLGVGGGVHRHAVRVAATSRLPSCQPPVMLYAVSRGILSRSAQALGRTGGQAGPKLVYELDPCQCCLPEL